MAEEKPSDKKTNFHLSWKDIWTSCRFWEKAAFVFFLVVGLWAGSQLVTDYRERFTEFQPAFGGTYREGSVGQPRFLNPLYSPANNPDQDIVELVFSGLMKYDARGQLIPDLAESYQISEDGRIYHFKLRDNAFWHDHEPVTADDVIFTIRTIQNPDYKSPLRAGWLGVETEKISDWEIRLILDAPYAGFLETATAKIIPRHIWKETPALTFPLAVSSTLSFIGSGPYRFQELDLDNQKRVQALHLETFNRYYLDRPHISQVTFRFYEDEEALLNGARRGEIDAFSLTNPRAADLDRIGFTPHRLDMPRYFSVFFNPNQSQLLAVGAIRQALIHGIDKEKLAAQVAADRSQPTNSPILPDFYGFDQPTEPMVYDPDRAGEILDGLGYELIEDSVYRQKEPTIREDVFRSDLRTGSQGAEVRALQECLAGFPEIYPDGEVTGHFGPKTREAVKRFQEEYAEEILDPWGFSEGTGLVSRTTRAKLNQVCFVQESRPDPVEFKLTTVDQPHLVQLAQALKEQWKEIGVKVNIEYFPASELESTVINPRNYEALLLGQVLGTIPDPLPFWHSSRKREPGVNLALYENERADNLLEKARTAGDPIIRRVLLEEFQDVLLADRPAVFLYRLDYVHFVSPGVQGYNIERIVAPPQRFSSIGEWYLRTRRVWMK